MEQITLQTETKILKYYFECPICLCETDISVENFKLEYGNYPYNQEIECSGCHTKYIIEDVDY